MKPYKDNVAAMYAPFGEYVPKVAKLMVWHIWDLARHSGTTADEQMNNVAWLTRLATIDSRVITDISSLPEWRKVRSQLMTIIDNCKSDSQTYSMELQCLDILLPMFKPRFKLGYVFPEQPFHHMWYTLHKENTVVAVHFINADMPDSPFEDMKKFANHLLMAIEDACKKYSTVRVAECGTWMNNVPRFLQYWPDSYRNNRIDWKDTGGFGPGWWGQYMTATGGFNDKAADFLRSTGKHRHPLSVGRCPVEDALSHLRDFLR